MKQAISIALLLIAATCLGLAHEHGDYGWRSHKHSRYFTLEFDFAARKGIAFNSNSFTVHWNGEQILNNYPGDYAIHAFSFRVRAHSGENTLTFTGTGKQDSYGACIANIRLLRTNYWGEEEDAIVNGDFTKGTNVGTGWKIFDSIPGWSATNQIEIGHGLIYNGKWPPGTLVTELDANKNTAITQTITLDHHRKVVCPEDS